MSIDQRLHEAADRLRASLADLAPSEPPQPTSRTAPRRGLAFALAVLVVAVAGVALTWDTDQGKSLSTTPSTDPTTSVPSATSTTDAGPPPLESVIVPGEWPAGPVFAGVTLEGDVVLADPTTGEVLRALLPASSGAAAVDVALADSGDTVYVGTLIDLRGGPLLRLRPGEPVTVMGSAEVVAVSPDGALLATINGEGYRTTEIKILDAESGAVVSSTSLDELTGNGELYVRNVEWDESGDRLLVEAGLPEAGSELYLVVPEVSARRIGPPTTRPNGTGWTLGGPLLGGRVLVAEDCCALDANSYETDSALLEIDIATGAEQSRIPLGDNFARPSINSDGQRLIVTDCCGSPDTQVLGADLRPLGGPIYAAIDW